MILNKIKINDTTTVNTGIVYDISKAHGGATYTDLADALGTDGINVPLEVKEGGMSVKFIQTSDNNYVQYRLMNQNWSTVVTDWQGVDNEPTAGSDNLVKSEGVANDIAKLTTAIENINKDVYLRKAFVNPEVPDASLVPGSGTQVTYASKSVLLVRPNLDGKTLNYVT